MLWLYRLLFLLLLPVMILRLGWRGFKEPQYWQRLQERFGFLPLTVYQATNNKPLIWLHCVSVGEFLGAKPLIKKLLIQDTHQLFITTTTPSGSAQVKQHYQNNKQVLHSYMPFDVTWFYLKLIKKLRPSLCLIMETEIWPNHLIVLKKHKIPSVLINARLSERSFKRYQKLHAFTQFILQNLSHIASQNTQSYDYFTQLGVNPDKLSHEGNLKFDLNLTLDDIKLTALKTMTHHRPIILFASTHNKEEAMILSSYSVYKNNFKDALIVLAPRHPRRADEVITLLKQHQLSHHKRSDNQVCTQDIEVLLLDTLGELLSFYALARLCFVGGSLIARGGHNMLEPAGFKKPILFGKHTQNFPEIASQLLSLDGAIQVEDAHDLWAKLNTLYNNTAKANNLGQNAYRYFLQHQGASDNLLQLIQSFKDLKK